MKGIFQSKEEMWNEYTEEIYCLHYVLRAGIVDDSGAGIRGRWGWRGDGDV